MDDSSKRTKLVDSNENANIFVAASYALEFIFPLLDRRSLFNAGSTCRLWNKIQRKIMRNDAESFLREFRNQFKGRIGKNYLERISKSSISEGTYLRVV